MKKIQSGRSMVEMLGVLAVMGIISVGGLYGYTYAMKRHRANELMNEANKRAVMVASQLMAGKDPRDVTMDEFPADTPYGSFSPAVVQVGDDKFKMRISDLDKEVCELMDSLAGGPVRRVECVAEETSTFTAEMYFNKDLSTEERASDFTTPDSCKSPYKWCLGSGTTGQCSDKTDCCEGLVYDNVCQSCDPETGKLTDNYDSTCQTCENGEITNNYNLCQTCENGVITENNNQCQTCDPTTGIVTNVPDSPATSCTITTTNDAICQSGECIIDYSGTPCNHADNRECGGQNSRYYCAFASTSLQCIASSSDSLRPSSGSGTCESVTSYRGTTITGTDKKNEHIYNGTEMDWWSANAWCIAKGSTGLLTCDGTGVSHSCSFDDLSSTTTEFSHISQSNDWFNYWLRNLPSNNSCYAFEVGFTGSNNYVRSSYARKTSTMLCALCE